MTGTQYVSCTIMAKDKEGRIAFLVKKEGDEFSLPTASFARDQTGLACVINRLKDVVTFEVSDLELNELTNAVVNEERIPLFVFTYQNEHQMDLDQLVESDVYSWQYSDSLYRTLEKWHITGVPQF